MSGDGASERVRARAILNAAGAPTEHLRRVRNGFTASVWATPGLVVKMGPAGSPCLRREWRFLRAARRAAPTLPLPPVIAFGHDRSGDFILERRLPGASLLERWPAWPERTRVHCARKLAALIRTLHDSTRRSGPSQSGSAFYRDLQRSLQRLAGTPGLAPVVLDATRRLARQGAETDDRTTFTVLVHNDLQFNNLLADDRGNITGLLDFGRARRAPPDLELDLLLRFLRFPHLFACKADEGRMRPDDFADVVPVLREALPDLFSTDGTARLRLYSLAYDFRQLAHAPHVLSTRSGTPWARILAVLEPTGSARG